MKTRHYVVLLALIAALNLLPACPVKAQTSINGDGAYPYAGLILSGNTLYGTAAGGGSSSAGTVFAANTDGTGFTNLHSFTSAPAPVGINSDGAYPHAGLIVSGNIRYGTALQGGSSGLGTVFKVNANGTGFTNLHSFTTLLAQVPQLTIYLSGTNVFLMWPAGFDTLQYTYRLQTTANLVSSAVWTYVSPDPIVANGQKIVANPITGTQQFYRLSPQTGGGPGPGCTSDMDCGPGYQCIGGNCVDRQ